MTWKERIAAEVEPHGGIEPPTYCVDSPVVLAN